MGNRTENVLNEVEDKANISPCMVCILVNTPLFRAISSRCRKCGTLNKEGTKIGR